MDTEDNKPSRNLELDSLRAYTDEEVCQLLGGIGRTTLWHLRDNPRGPHALKSGYAYPGSRARRTTAQQIRDYLALVETHANVLAREREELERGVEAQIERQGGRRVA